MRILIIEDEPDLRQSLAAGLREEGYAVDTAGNGETGLYQALNHEYDAVLLDVRLPRLDGWTVLERLREAKVTPVLLLTSCGVLADRVRGLDAGADDYLVKPFDFAELSARLRAVIRRYARQGRSVIDLGTVRLDTGRRTVAQAGVPVTLTPLEYRLIEYLALHRGKVISRATLYEHLADETGDLASNLLDVHVFNIRRKLGAKFITTRRGHGYSLE